MEINLNFIFIKIKKVNKKLQRVDLKTYKNIKKLYIKKMI